MPAKTEYRCVSCGLTDKGKVRGHNEDNFLEAGQEGIWVVADGAGGHDRGEVASEMIVQGLAQIKRQPFLGNLVEAVSACLQSVNTRLIGMRNLPGSRGIIGSTVCVLIIHGQHSVCLWAGDSRIYLLRDGKLRPLTRDHNRMDEFLGAGFSVQDIKKYPAARQLTRAVGAASPLMLEAQIQECRVGDVFLICSDGLHGEMTDEEIASVLREGKEPSETARQLLDTVLTRRAHDNVTILLVHIRKE
jgi:serine/threonine protein phosphatase PrpC